MRHTSPVQKDRVVSASVAGPTFCVRPCGGPPCSTVNSHAGARSYCGVGVPLKVDEVLQKSVKIMEAIQEAKVQICNQMGRVVAGEKVVDAIWNKKRQDRFPTIFRSIMKSGVNTDCIA